MPPPSRALVLALAQINPCVGDLEGNAELICSATADAAARGADLVAFPEMALTGYPVEDLALRPSFQVAASEALERLAHRLAEQGLGAMAALVGYLGTDPGNGRPQNSFALLSAGAVVASHAKHHLPNYGVFDEARYFSPAFGLFVHEIAGHVVAAAVCEDLWEDGGPVAEVRSAGADVLIVLNGSPYERDKGRRRLNLAARRAAECGCPVAYVNMVGGQDQLVFDGGSFALAPDGRVIAAGQRFLPDLVMVDLGSPAAVDAEHLTGEGPADVYGALVTGLRDYAGKNGFTSAALGLSGGIDSALTAALACDALGAQAVHGVAMPTSHSSEHSVSDAVELARRTGLRYREVPIQSMVDAFLESVTLDGLAWENLQARVRGMILMSLSNQHGHLVLATGNKSELAVGYSTLYGDTVGGFAPLKDILKTDVWALARWRNTAEGQATATRVSGLPAAPAPIPENSIRKAPSAELRPDQYDSDALPDYALLDEVLSRYIERDSSGAEIVAAGLPPATVVQVLRLVDAAEFKRRQYPPGPKVSVRNFGSGRRMPITSSWREVVLPQAE